MKPTSICQPYFEPDDTREQRLRKALERLLAAVLLMRGGYPNQDWLGPSWCGPIQEAEQALQKGAV